MPKKPSYKELEQKVKELDKKEVMLKRTEDALRESEEKYRTLFEGANDAIFIADTKTNIILDVNRQAEQLIGRPRHEIIGMHQSQLHPSSHAE